MVMLGALGARLRGWLSPAWPAHAAQAIPGQSQVVQLIMFASLYFVGQAKMTSCLCSITQPGQSIKALANMWANSLQPAKMRPGQPCSRDTTFSVVSPGPGRGALFGCRGTGSLAGQRRKHGKLHAASAAGLQSRPRKRAPKCVAPALPTTTLSLACNGPRPRPRRMPTTGLLIQPFYTVHTNKKVHSRSSRRARAMHISICVLLFCNVTVTYRKKKAIWPLHDHTSRPLSKASE
jgi:hypothetical protein